MTEEKNQKANLRRIGGRLHRVTPLLDDEGEVIQLHTTPLRLEVRPKDVMQIVAGASLLSIPVAFTEEAWRLGETLPTFNIVALVVLSLLVIATFVYLNSYRNHIREFFGEYLKRIGITYFASFFIVGLLLTIIEQCPWGVDNLLAIKRILIVSFPATISGTISDMLE